MKELDEVIAQRGHPNERGHAPVSPAQGAQGTADLTLLRSGGDLTRINFTSHRRNLGPLVVLAKRGLSRLLTPILERQSAYNAANARVIASLKNEILRPVGHAYAARYDHDAAWGEGMNFSPPQTLGLASPVLADNLPSQPDDPRLDQWYHTIDLGNGLTSRGILRPSPDPPLL